MTALADVFAESGLLARHLEGFSYREPQQRMAELVEHALDSRQHAVLEAGTGIGKTYAYVVPILLSNRRAIISTGTKTLQDQLFARDLPALGKALGRPVDIALLKGRANYLCWHRLQNARLDGRLRAPLQSSIDALARWGRSSDSGDLTEIDDLEDDFALRARVTSTVDNCLGSQCDRLDECFVLKARRRAQAARIVIVNHHLLLADLSLKEAGFGELLPGSDCVIVDEAHLLPDIAQQFFDVSVSSRQLVRLGHDIAEEARVAAAGRPLETGALKLADAVAPLIAEAARDAGRRAGVPSRIESALARIGDELTLLADELAAFEGDAGLERCRERCIAARERLEAVLAGDRDLGLKWFEAADACFSAHYTPFDVGRAMAERIGEQGGSWILTSASLAVGDSFAHFTDRLGIGSGGEVTARDAAGGGTARGGTGHIVGRDASDSANDTREPRAVIEAVLPSPFDYQTQGALYLPPGLPQPNDPNYTEALLASVWPLIVAAGGGAFLLFTSHRALGVAERWLSTRPLPGRLFVQGQGARSRLLEDFRAAGDGILLGTGSFWQGVDVRGPALRVVVIDKLPFAVPGDPLIQARIESIRRNGGDPFATFQLPEAVLSLKQGVGRLIRDFDDRGLIVLGDPRLRSRGYGRVFLASLPPFPVLDDAGAALDFVESLQSALPTMTASA